MGSDTPNHTEHRKTKRQRERGSTVKDPDFQPAKKKKKQQQDSNNVQAAERKIIDPGSLESEQIDLVRPRGTAGDESKQPDQSRQSGKDRGEPVLPWMRVPVEIEAGGGVPFVHVRGMDSRLQNALLKCGYKELFPVQAAAWVTLAGGMSRAHDLCICAPTGSGKTLAYALPILQGLTRSGRHSLGALVVLPTRELAVQVYDVFGALSPAVALWTGLAAARLTLAAESSALLEHPPNVLVATPGRLMAHCKAAQPAFSLTSLRFLVVDETDRLLRQAYQDWLPHVVGLTSRTGSAAVSRGADHDDAGAVKVVASATLTQDPAKIGRLELHAPRYIAMSSTDHRYKVPLQLKEYQMVGAAADKPLLLTALLQHLHPARIVVFAASLQATHRLFLLLSEMESIGPEVAEHSSTAVGRKGESGGLAAFRSGGVRVLIASDALTRGMDVPGVDVVINYDPPVYAKTYVHRAGRTARAGKQGTVVSILTAEQMRHWRNLLRKVDNTFVKEFALPPKLVNSLRPGFQQALLRAAALTEEAVG